MSRDGSVRCKPQRVSWADRGAQQYWPTNSEFDDLNHLSSFPEAPLVSVADASMMNTEKNRAPENGWLDWIPEASASTMANGRGRKGMTLSLAGDVCGPSMRFESVL